MSDTIEQVIADVQSVCPDVDPNLARMWVRDAGRRTMEAAPWSWLIKRGQWIVPARRNNVTLGATVSMTQADDVITFSGSVADPTMVGLQFRQTDASPIYDIVGYVSPTQLRIKPAWGLANASNVGFSIFQSKLIVPADVQEILAVVSPVNRWQLWLGVPQSILDGNDPSRSRGAASNPCLLSPLDYLDAYSGTTDSALLVSGTGSKPVTSGEYTGQNNAIFTVQVTKAGVGGVAEFQWRKDEGSWTTGVVSNAASGNDLQDGVTVLFQAASTYNLNALFIIRCTANASTSLPRMELYPYPVGAITLHYLYISRYPDLTDPGVRIPGFLASRGDILREKALEAAASWPGTEDRPNPYNQINRRDYHAANWTLLTAELVKQDRGLFQTAVQPARSLPWAPWPFVGTRNLQEYDPWYMYPQDIY